MRLRYLARNAAARQALEVLQRVADIKEHDTRLALVFRADGRVRYLADLPDLLEAAAHVVAAGDDGSVAQPLPWRARMSVRPAPRSVSRRLPDEESADPWRERALAAEARARALEPAGQRYATLRRAVARHLHPDASPEDGAERALRGKLFQQLWSVVEEMEAAR